MSLKDECSNSRKQCARYRKSAKCQENPNTTIKVLSHKGELESSASRPYCTDLSTSPKFFFATTAFYFANAAVTLVGHSRAFISIDDVNIYWWRHKSSIHAACLHDVTHDVHEVLNVHNVLSSDTHTIHFNDLPGTYRYTFMVEYNPNIQKHTWDSRIRTEPATTKVNTTCREDPNISSLFCDSYKDYKFTWYSLILVLWCITNDAGWCERIRNRICNLQESANYWWCYFVWMPVGW